MRVAVYSRSLKEEDLPCIQEFFDLLFEMGTEVSVYRHFLESVHQKITFQKEFGVVEGYQDFVSQSFDFVVTLGGDGTILSAITEVRDSKVPVVGINLGRLGFLASIDKLKIREALEGMQQGMYAIEKRRMLYLESSHPLFGETPFALNDFTLLKRDTSSMITIHTYINGAFLNSYWADGLIVATPTGSTGYSLSCGGPIIFPNSGNFVITPVAPHNLNVRPIVISDSSVISFQVEGRGENFLCTLDSRFETISAVHQLAVRKCDFNLCLVRMPGTSFLGTLSEKLAWGLDSRN
jgi:NAD+ kinase